MKLYAPLLLKKEIIIEVMGIPQTSPLCFAEGMVGAMPVFDTLEAAKEYGGEDCETVMIEI